MNQRIKKKLNRRLNIKSYENAPNCYNITDNNKYLKRNVVFLSFAKCNCNCWDCGICKIK